MTKNVHHVAVTSFSDSGQNGELVSGSDGTAQFAVCEKNTITYKKSHKKGNDTLIPHPQSERLVKSGTLVLAHEVGESLQHEEIVQKLTTFIHKYVELPETFEAIAAHYVLLTWVYDSFNEVPYLRVRGDYGTGKTRFLTVIGSICHRAIFASGASTTAPIFHLLNDLRGTLVLDESDFRYSDTTAEITKILNNGNAKGFSVLRCEQTKDGRFSARSYNIFGPKIVATRESFADDALESRFITQDLHGGKLRQDIPISLPASFDQEALQLRNILLRYRFTHLGTPLTQEECVVSASGRMQQIYRPLLSLIRDEKTRKAVVERIASEEEQLLHDRGLKTESELLRVIRDLQSKGTVLSITGITNAFITRYGRRYDRRITPKWVGWLLRSKLQLTTHKIGSTYVIAGNQQEKLTYLFTKFDVEHGNTPVR